MAKRERIDINAPDVPVKPFPPKHWNAQKDGFAYTYAGIHNKIRKTRGKASQQNCIDCGKQAIDWSHVHDTDPNYVANYEPRCRSCHWAYDNRR